MKVTLWTYGVNMDILTMMTLAIYLLSGQSRFSLFPPVTLAVIITSEMLEAEAAYGRPFHTINGMRLARTSTCFVALYQISTTIEVMVFQFVVCFASIQKIIYPDTFSAQARHNVITIRQPLIS